MTSDENTSAKSGNLFSRYKEQIAGYPNTEELSREENKMLDSPPVSYEFHKLEALVIILVIQAAISNVPGLADDEFGKSAIAVARRMQETLFDQNSATYKALEYGWNPEAYIIASAPNILKAMLEESRQKDKGEAAQ